MLTGLFPGFRSHGNYETDSSPLKGDLKQYGDLSKLIISQYKTLRDLQPDAASSNYNLEVLRQFRKTRFQESIDKVGRVPRSQKPPMLTAT